jgi:hypothetical protein
MSLEKFIPVRTVFYETVVIFQEDSWILGYQSGNATISDLPSEVYTRSKFLDNLPRHRTFGLHSATRCG